MKLSALFVSKSTAVHIRQLYAGTEAQKQIRLHGQKNARLFFALSAVTVLIFIPVFAADHIKLSRPLTSIDRNTYGQGTKTVTLRVEASDGYTEAISFDVSERKYTDEEIMEFSKKLDDELWTAILGENTGEHITHDLDLKKHYEGYPFDISWKSDEPLILNNKGEIYTERLEKEDPDGKGIMVRLCATLKYGEYTEDKYLYVVVHKKAGSAVESETDVINRAIRKSGGISETKSIQELPASAGGKRISFYPSFLNRGWTVLFLGLAAAFLVIKRRDTAIKEEAGNRRKQIEADHPVILNQYMLYFLAGMNPRAIWNCICEKYEGSIREEGSGRRYAYEEMLTARNRMDEGCSELAAYDEFAARCDNIRFRSFISLVKQAVVKGNEGLGEILYEEVDKAQRDRNNRIKTQASEAETKLLLPMFMMLIIVLAIVMIPAFIGLND